MRCRLGYLIGTVIGYALATAIGLGIGAALAWLLIEVWVRISGG